jgi:SecD/SecF fusion protein
MTRYFFAGWVQNPAHKELKMSQWISGANFNFLNKAKPAIIISLIVMALGTFMLYQERKTIFGMDFTGGYSLTVEVENKAPDAHSYRIQALDALMKAGASSTDAEVRELTLPNQLRIRLGAGMDEKGHPFYGMAEHLSDGMFTYEYQKNPRIDWTVKALEASGLKISDYSKKSLDTNWSVVSGQLSDAMRNNAIIGLAIALASILIYITFRFEFKYAVAAVVGLVHDVIITLGLLAILHAMGLPLAIDLTVVGAIMTIIGYSLNDTIIVFDRIREDLKILKRLSFAEAVNHALNITLSRTLMTSGTTLLVLLALVFLGGSSIFAFSLVMTIGVLIGTFSSLFIAAPMVVWLHDREEANEAALSSKKS